MVVKLINMESRNYKFYYIFCYHITLDIFARKQIIVLKIKMEYLLYEIVKYYLKLLENKGKVSIDNECVNLLRHEIFKCYDIARPLVETFKEAFEKSNNFVSFLLNLDQEYNSDSNYLTFQSQFQQYKRKINSGNDSCLNCPRHCEHYKSVHHQECLHCPIHCKDITHRNHNDHHHPRDSHHIEHDSTHIDHNNHNTREYSKDTDFGLEALQDTEMICCSDEPHHTYTIDCKHPNFDGSCLFCLNSKLKSYESTIDHLKSKLNENTTEIRSLNDSLVQYKENLSTCDKNNKELISFNEAMVEDLNKSKSITESYAEQVQIMKQRLLDCENFNHSDTMADLAKTRSDLHGQQVINIKLQARCDDANKKFNECERSKLEIESTYQQKLALLQIKHETLGASARALGLANEHAMVHDDLHLTHATDFQSRLASSHHDLSHHISEFTTEARKCDLEQRQHLQNLLNRAEVGIIDHTRRIEELNESNRQQHMRNDDLESTNKLLKKENSKYKDLIPFITLIHDALSDYSDENIGKLEYFDSNNEVVIGLKTRLCSLIREFRLQREKCVPITFGNTNLDDIKNVFQNVHDEASILSALKRVNILDYFARIGEISEIIKKYLNINITELTLSRSTIINEFEKLLMHEARANALDKRLNNQDIENNVCQDSLERITLERNDLHSDNHTLRETIQTNSDIIGTLKIKVADHNKLEKNLDEKSRLLQAQTETLNKLEIDHNQLRDEYNRNLESSKSKNPSNVDIGNFLQQIGEIIKKFYKDNDLSMEDYEKFTDLYSGIKYLDAGKISNRLSDIASRIITLTKENSKSIMENKKITLENSDNTKTFEKSISDARQEFESIKKSLDEQLTKLKAKIEKQKSTITNKNNEIEKLRAELVTIGTEISELNTKISKYEKLIQEQQATMNANTMELKSLSDKILNLNNSEMKCTQTTSTLQTNQEQLKNEIAILKQTKTNLEGKIEGMNKGLILKNKFIEDYVIRNEFLQKEFDNLQHKNLESYTKNTALEQSNLDFKNIIDSNNEKLVKFDDIKKDLDRHIKQQKILRSKLAEATEKCEKYESDHIESNKIIREFKIKIKEVQTKLDELTSSNENSTLDAAQREEMLKKILKIPLLDESHKLSQLLISTIHYILLKKPDIFENNLQQLIKSIKENYDLLVEYNNNFERQLQENKQLILEIKQLKISNSFYENAILTTIDNHKIFEKENTDREAILTQERQKYIETLGEQKSELDKLTDLTNQQTRQLNEQSNRETELKKKNDELNTDIQVLRDENNELLEMNPDKINIEDLIPTILNHLEENEGSIRKLNSELYETLHETFLNFSTDSLLSFIKYILKTFDTLTITIHEDNKITVITTKLRSFERLRKLMKRVSNNVTEALTVIDEISRNYKPHEHHSQLLGHLHTFISYLINIKETEHWRLSLSHFLAQILQQDVRLILTRYVYKHGLGKLDENFAAELESSIEPPFQTNMAQYGMGADEYAQYRKSQSIASKLPGYFVQRKTKRINIHKPYFYINIICKNTKKILSLTLDLPQMYDKHIIENFQILAAFYLGISPNHLLYSKDASEMKVKNRDIVENNSLTFIYLLNHDIFALIDNYKNSDGKLEYFATETQFGQINKSNDELNLLCTYTQGSVSYLLIMKSKDTISTMNFSYEGPTPALDQIKLVEFQKRDNLTDIENNQLNQGPVVELNSYQSQIIPANLLFYNSFINTNQFHQIFPLLELDDGEQSVLRNMPKQTVSMKILYKGKEYKFELSGQVIYITKIFLAFIDLLIIFIPDAYMATYHYQDLDHDYKIYVRLHCDPFNASHSDIDNLVLPLRHENQKVFKILTDFNIESDEEFLNEYSFIHGKEKISGYPIYKTDDVFIFFQFNHTTNTKKVICLNYNGYFNCLDETKYKCETEVIRFLHSHGLINVVGHQSKRKRKFSFDE
jgi:hypothetical protein